jgi:hypothetical protein
VKARGDMTFPPETAYERRIPELPEPLTPGGGQRSRGAAVDSPWTTTDTTT